MKKVIVGIILAAFATVTSLQAGEQCTKEKTAGCGTQTVKASTSCTAEKSCCATSTAKKVVRKNDQVKGAVLLVRR